MREAKSLGLRFLDMRLVLFMVLFTVIGGVAVAAFLHSEPYEFGKHFVAADSRVVAITGMPDRVSLRYTRKSRYSFGERTGSATMTLQSETVRGSYDVQLHLVKHAGQWSVNRAEVFKDGTAPILVVSEPLAAECCKQ